MTAFKHETDPRRHWALTSMPTYMILDLGIKNLYRQRQSCSDLWEGGWNPTACTQKNMYAKICQNIHKKINIFPVMEDLDICFRSTEHRTDTSVKT